MRLNEIKHLINNGEDYKFIWDGTYEPILISLGGSWAYGTNKEDSDIDVRGIVMDPKNSILGLSNFEQKEVHDKDKDVDCVLYSLKKMLNLLLGCNPNCIEILSPQERNIIYINDVGKKILDNRHLFLSKKAAFTFNAYASAQLARLENAVCRDSLPEKRKEEHIKASIERMFSHFEEHYTKFDANNSIKLKVREADRGDREFDIFADITLKDYPLRDYRGIWNDINTTIKNYDQLNGRNSKKDNNHLNKHMMHLVRLYLMGIDILEKEEIITYRENDLDLLMSVRHGDYMFEDGTVDPKFYEMVDKLKIRFEKAKENTKLPEKPNFKEVEKLLIGIYEEYLR